MATIYLVHGTFAGDDALGLFAELGRFAPRLARALRELEKRMADAVAGETGNYTQAYAERMEAALSAGAGRTIPVRRFSWSSQNTHVGRADGAVNLIEELAADATALAAVEPAMTQPPRILLWAQSHGGNVLALASNLLGSDDVQRAEFFAAARSYYRPWVARRADQPAWPRVEKLLADPAHPLRRTALDFVTFGTPIRYGWEPAGFAKLLHFVNHRPVENRPEYLARWPVHLGRFLRAADGDGVNQLGVAGSGFPALPLSPRTVFANWKLRQYLARGVAWWLPANMRHGMRVPHAGTTLLVDYDEPTANPFTSLFGHALYTRSRWLAWHCEQVAREFYGS